MNRPSSVWNIEITRPTNFLPMFASGPGLQAFRRPRSIWMNGRRRIDWHVNLNGQLMFSGDTSVCRSIGLDAIYSCFVGKTTSSICQGPGRRSRCVRRDVSLEPAQMSIFPISRCAWRLPTSQVYWLSRVSPLYRPWLFLILLRPTLRGHIDVLYRILA